MVPRSERIPVIFRWLGTGGLWFAVQDQILVVDPYLSRVPLNALWRGPLHPDPETVTALIPRCDHILVTHAHFDHILDVPALVAHAGATAYGSVNTCRLLAACGVTNAQRLEIGHTVTMGPFQVEVQRAYHVPIPGFGPGTLPARLQPPFRARQYRMDGLYSYRLSIGDLRVLTDPGTHPDMALAADVVFVHPGTDHRYFEELVERVEPALVVPYHWDNFFRPLSQPVKPMLQPPRWTWPPIKRVDLAAFCQLMHTIDPGIQVFVPEVMQAYHLSEDRRLRAGPQPLPNGK